MIEITQEEFETLVSRGIDRLPDHIIKTLDNVVILTADCPTETQRAKAGGPPVTSDTECHHGWLLFGLYEGVPKTKRGSNYTLVLPDVITIFKKPLASVSHSLDDMERRVANTVWHEVAHHFGLNHDRIHELENKS